MNPIAADIARIRDYRLPREADAVVAAAAAVRSARQARGMANEAHQAACVAAVRQAAARSTTAMVSTAADLEAAELVVGEARAKLAAERERAAPIVRKALAPQMAAARAVIGALVQQLDDATDAITDLGRAAERGGIDSPGRLLTSAPLLRALVRDLKGTLQ